MAKYPIITVNTANPDPTAAINAFLWTMNKARELGLMPPTEHILAEHMFRNDARIVFYSSAAGVTSLVMDDDAVDDFDDEDTFQFLMAVLRRRKERRRAKREAAQGMETREGGDDEAAPSRSDDSPVGETDAPASSDPNHLNTGEVV